MYLVAIGWMYVVLMMALVEAFSAQGSVFSALITLLLYGVLPLSILLYIMGTPLRRRRRQRLETKAAASDAPGNASTPETFVSAAGGTRSVPPDDASDHAARASIAAEGEKRVG
jgi:membrane protein implicated in regulation of membrane protease activity